MTLISDILDMTKIESSGIELDPQPYILKSLLPKNAKQDGFTQGYYGNRSQTGPAGL